MAEKLVTVADFASTAEAELAQSILEGEGIPAFLEGGTLVNWAWFLSNAVGGVKLQVPEGSLQRAREILQQASAAETEDSAAEGEHGTPEDPLQTADDESETLPTDPGDAEAARAFRAAVLGCFLCPGLLHLYSLWVLAILWIDRMPLSPRGWRSVGLAASIDAVVLGAIALVVHG